MGCAAGTMVANANEDEDQQKSEMKEGDKNPLTRATADSGNFSKKDTNVFGDQIEHRQEVTTDGSNVHNTPSNVLENHSSMSSHADKNSEKADNLSTSSLIHNDEIEPRKTPDTSNNQMENLLKKSDNDTVDEIESKVTCSPGHVPRSTLNISDEEKSQLISQLSPEYTKQLEVSLRFKLQHIDIINGDHDKRNFEYKNPTSDNPFYCADIDKSENMSQPLRTLSGSNKLPLLDSTTANAEMNYSLDNDDNATTSAGNNNQNEEPANIDFSSHRLSPIVRNNIRISNIESMNNGDMGLTDLDPFNVKNHGFNVEDSQMHVNVPMQHRKSSLPRASHAFAITRHSFVSPSFKHKGLNIAECNDIDRNDIKENDYHE